MEQPQSSPPHRRCPLRAAVGYDRERVLLSISAFKAKAWSVPTGCNRRCLQAHLATLGITPGDRAIRGPCRSTRAPPHRHGVSCSFTPHRHGPWPPSCASSGPRGRCAAEGGSCATAPASDYVRRIPENYLARPPTTRRRACATAWSTRTPADLSELSDPTTTWPACILRSRSRPAAARTRGGVILDLLDPGRRSGVAPSTSRISCRRMSTIQERADRLTQEHDGGRADHGNSHHGRHPRRG